MRTASRLLFCTIAGTALVGAVNLLPAAAAIIDSDIMKADGVVADFGSGLDVGGTPAGNGTLTWDYTPGNVTANLTGQVYRNVSTAGGCAKVNLVLIDQAGLVIPGTSRTSGAACRGVLFAPGPVRAVTLTASDPRAFRAVIHTMSSTSLTGLYANDKADNVYFGNLNGNAGQD